MSEGHGYPLVYQITSMLPELQDYDNVLECQEPGYSTMSYKDTKCHLLKHTGAFNYSHPLIKRWHCMENSLTCKKTYGWNR
jgi:hypothetical protein